MLRQLTTTPNTVTTTSVTASTPPRSHSSPTTWHPSSITCSRPWVESAVYGPGIDPTAGRDVDGKEPELQDDSAVATIIPQARKPMSRLRWFRRRQAEGLWFQYTSHSRE